jgi:MraZ protein
MSVQVANEPIIYNGEFHHGVDEKRRVQVPARWCPPKSVEFTLVVWPKHQAGICLRALPSEQMLKLMQQIEAMPPNDPNKGILKRAIGSQSIQVKLDSAGRICIPEQMAAAAEISDKAVLVGLLDRFEIWNSTRYEKVKMVDAILGARAFDMME